MSLQQEEPLLGRDTNDTALQKKSYTSLMLFYLLYNLQYAIVIPAVPALVLELMHDDTSESAYMLGMISFVRYIVEFFFSPICGQLSDIKGRKTMLMVAFAACFLEYTLCMIFPKIGTIFAAKVISGMFDSGIATGITMASDVAFYNEDEVAVAYGLMGSMMGVAFVLGPLSGGILCGVSVQLCYLVGAALALFCLIFGHFFLEETLDLNHHDIHFSTCPEAFCDAVELDVETATNTAVNAAPTAGQLGHNYKQTVAGEYDFEYHLPPTPKIPGAAFSPQQLDSPVGPNPNNSAPNPKPSVEDLPPLDANANEMLQRLNLKRRTTVNFAEANPVPALMLHFSNKRLRQLSIAMFCTGIASSNLSIFYMYMFDTFSSSSAEVGAFISFFALVAVGVQGFAVRRLIPAVWSESRAIMWGLVFSGLQSIAFAFVTQLWMMFVVAIVFALHTINDPALKALIVNQSRLFEHSVNISSRSVSSTGMTHQGNLQGVLGSLRTLSTGLGSLVFSSLYGFGVKQRETWLSWVVGAACYGLVFAYLYDIFYVQWGLNNDTDSSGKQNSDYISVSDSDEDCSDSQKISGWDFETAKEVLSEASETASDHGLSVSYGTPGTPSLGISGSGFGTGAGSSSSSVDAGTNSSM